MGMKKWEVAELNKALAKTLAEECDADPIVALIASARGYNDPVSLEEFLADEPCFEDPHILADMDVAYNRITAEIENGGKIAVYGDYDCDGVVATTLMYSYLSARGADCVYYIPDRFDEGYGMNIAAVEKLAKMGVKLIITVDNGIACIKEIERANELGIDVVVTDHHLPTEVLPAAVAVVDPHRADCPSEFKEICGAEVAFKLICALEDREPEELLPFYADLLSVAVLADIMPLTLENRSIVKRGIAKLKNNPSVGLNAIMSVAAIKRDNINAGRIAFGIAPKINAAGRMGSPDRAVELLLSENALNALEIAGEIDEKNSARRQIEKDIFDEAEKIIERNNLKYDRVIVVHGKEWHSGVLGIVASRITERYGVPSVVLSGEGNEVSGSCRSINGFSIYAALKASSDCLLSFGGHELAAGLHLKEENIDAFRNAVNTYAVGMAFVPPVLKIDCKLNPPALSVDLSEAIKDLEPFGQGNATPLFGVFGVKLIRVTPIGGGKHLRLLFTKGDNTFLALLFGVTEDKLCFRVDDVLDLAVTVETNVFKGEYSVSVQIKAMRMSETDDDKLFYEMDNLGKFMLGKSFNRKAVLPSREEVGVIYKLISSAPVLEDRIKYLHLKDIGYAKIEIALITLSELGLIEKDKNGIYKSTGAHAKTELKNSVTYRKLLEGSGNV